MIPNNVGVVDRVIRLVVGVALLALLAVGPVPGWGLFGLLGLIGVVTGLTGYCPTYTLVGIDTSNKAPGDGTAGARS